MRSEQNSSQLDPGGWPASSLQEHKLLGKFNRSVSMLAWAYNEEKLVADFLDRAVTILECTVNDWEIVFVDDCSTDKTLEILNDYAARDARIRVIRHERNLNVGMGTRTAIANARKEFLFWQTVDWSYDISKLRVCLELLNHFDAVQGIRPVPIRLLSYIPLLRSIYRVSRRSDNFRKAVVSLSNYYLLRILFSVPFHDFQNITFYRTASVQELPLRGRTSFVNPELLIRSYYSGTRFIEVPLRFLPRTAGDAKGTKLKSIIGSVLDILRNWFAWGLVQRFRAKKSSQQISRVAEPFRLNQNVLRLILPMFDDYR